MVVEKMRERQIIRTMHRKRENMIKTKCVKDEKKRVGEE
jgi:hypothetical protein